MCPQSNGIFSSDTDQIQQNDVNYFMRLTAAQDFPLITFDKNKRTNMALNTQKGTFGLLRKNVVSDQPALSKATLYDSIRFCATVDLL